MDFRIIKTVISREYTTRVKKKSFLVTTFVVPILFAAMMVVVFLIMGNTKERKMDVAVVDQSGIVMSHLESGDRVTYTDYSSEVPDSIKAHLKDYGKDALVVVSPLDSVNPAAEELPAAAAPDAPAPDTPDAGPVSFPCRECGRC